jgi:class 3 adenylate cyclase
MKVIRAKSQVGFWLLLSVWLLVVVLPTSLFRSSFARFLSFSHEQQKQRVKPLLFAEMQQFKEDLAFDGVLEDELNAFDRKQGFVDNMPPDCDAAKIRSDLEQHLGFPVFMVLAHGVDTVHNDGSMAVASYAEVRLPPESMSRRFFALINDQMNCSALIPDKYRPAFTPGVAHDDAKVRRVYLEGFLQNLFSISVAFAIEPRRVYSAIASKVGDTGQIYLYYGTGRLRQGGARFNTGGYLAVIRVVDVAERHIVRRAARRTFYPGLHRRMTMLQPAVPDPDNFSWQGFSRIREEQGRFALTTLVPPRQLVRLIQKGGIVASDFSAFAGRAPGIEVFCRLSDLQHPLWHYQKEIYLLLRLLILLSGLVFMRLYLFGFDMNISLALKISMAVLAAGTLPLLSMLLTMAAYDDSARSARHDRIQRFIKIKSREIQDFVSAGIHAREEQARSLAENMSSMHGCSQDELRDVLKGWMKSRPVDAVLYKPLDGETMPVVSDAAKSYANASQNAETAMIILGPIVEMLLSSPRLNPDRHSMSTLLTEGSRNVESTHSMLISNGRILNLAKLHEHSRVAIVVVSHPGKVRVPAAVILIIYSLDRLLEEMLQAARSKFLMEQEFAGWQLDHAFGVELDGHVEQSGHVSSSRLESDFILRQMRACRSLQRDLQWHGRQGDDEVFSYVCFDQNLPLINLTVIRVPVTAGIMAGIESWRWLYPILLLLFTLLFASYFFISPALKLARGLSAIAGGDLSKRLHLRSGDEFEALALEFNQMAQSLQEKEQLEAYVSSDVLAEARTAEVADLRPGGERIGASVVFVSLLPLAREASDHAEQMSQINSFLDLSQFLCGENQGVIDKIIGHTLMLVFRASDNAVAHQLRACRMALQIVAAVKASQLGSSCRVVAGLACGQLVSGKIGSRSGRLDFTVIGDTVNLAARLKSYAESLAGSPLLVSEEMRAAVADSITTRLESQVQLKGKSLQTRVYRIV